MLDPYEAREVIAPQPAEAVSVRLTGLPAVGGGMVQGPLDDAPWRPGGYVPESGTVLLLTADGHPVSLESPPAADLSALTSRVAALETTVNTGSNRNSLLRSDLTSLAARVTALEADTGWLNLPLLPGFTAGSTGCQYRIRNGLVFLQGLVTRTAGNFPTSFTTMASLPIAARPPQTTDSYPSMTRTDGNLALIAVTAAGAINAASGNATDRVALSAIPPYLVN